MNAIEKYIRNLVGGLMCVIGFSTFGLIIFFSLTGIIFGYVTRPDFSPSGSFFAHTIIYLLVSLLIGGIGIRISPFGQAWLKKIDDDKLIEKHKKQLAEEAYQKELEAAKVAMDRKKQSVVIIDDDAIVIESDDQTQ